MNGGDTIKRIIIKIIISVIVISLAITGIALYNNLYLNKKPTNNNTTTTINNIEVTIMLTDIDNNIIINDKLNGNDKTLYDLLNENYNIRCEDGPHGKKILDFESVKTDFKNNYLAIYVNDIYSTKGLSYITLEDRIKIEFRETKL